MCREQLLLKYSVINNHVNCSKHNVGKARLKNKNQGEMELLEVLKSYDTVENPKDVTLPKDQRIYCIKVVHTFLIAGMPLNKLSALENYLRSMHTGCQIQ